MVIVPIWIFVGSQQRDRQNSHNLGNGIFCRLTVTSAQCILSTEKDPDSGIILNFDDDDYSLSYGKFKEAFKALTKDDILQPFISDHDFGSSINVDNVCYNLFVFDKRYHEFISAALP